MIALAKQQVHEELLSGIGNGLVRGSFIGQAIGAVVAGLIGWWILGS